SALQGRAVDLGQHRHLLRAVQPAQGRPAPAPGEDGSRAQAEGAKCHDLHPRRHAHDPGGMGAVPGDGLTDPPAVPEASSPPPRPEPATTDDIRSLRRWLLVAGVWAVAATAIAVIALVKANDANNDQENARTASQLTQVQRQLSSQLADLEKRIGE